MEEIDIEAAKRLKNTMWIPALKEFYEPQDVIRYFDEVNILPIIRQNNVIPPQKFFTEEVLKEGLVLLKIRNIKNLISEVEYLRDVKIPKLEEKLKILQDGNRE